MHIHPRLGKEAVTYWQKIMDFGRLALLSVQPVTGRTHQIRIHLQHIGDPVLGDRQYFSPLSADFPDVPRQMLHASELRFLHPATGKPVSAAAPLPRDFRDWLHTLRLT